MQSAKPTNSPSSRQSLKRLRLDLASLFPGLVKATLDPSAGTLKLSFIETKLTSVVKHRCLIGELLTKHGLPVHNPDTCFRLGTWRLRTDRARYINPDSQRKRVYYVLTLTLDPQPGDKVTCNFKPLWSRTSEPRSQAEIDAELRRVFSSKAILKTLGIPLTKKKLA